jgi:hypothetical protein
VGHTKGAFLINLIVEATTPDRLYSVMGEFYIGVKEGRNELEK